MRCQEVERLWGLDLHEIARTGLFVRGGQRADKGMRSVTGVIVP